MHHIISLVLFLGIEHFYDRDVNNLFFEVIVSQKMFTVNGCLPEYCLSETEIRDPITNISNNTTGQNKRLLLALKQTCSVFQ